MVDVQARHEKELRLAHSEKQALAEQFENVKDETKRLVAKLNSISLQKENKLLTDTEALKARLAESQ